MAVYKRKIATYAFQPNDTRDFNLLATRVLKNVYLTFAGTLTVAGGTVDGTLVQDGVLRTLLRSLKLLANGSNIIDVDGRMLYWFNAVITDSPNVLVEPGVTAGAHPVRAAFTVRLEQLASAARHAGRIDADGLDNLDLRIETGNPDGGIVTGGDRAETLAGNMEIVAEYDTDRSAFRGGYRRISRHTYTNAGATSDGRINLPSDVIVPGLLLIAVDNGARSDDIVNRVKVSVGEDDERRDLSWEAIQEENVDDFALELAAGAPPYTGIGYVNFDRDLDTNPAKILDLRGLKTDAGRVKLDIGAPTGVSYVEVYPVALGVGNKPR